MPRAQRVQLKAFNILFCRGYEGNFENDVHGCDEALLPASASEYTTQLLFVVYVMALSVALSGFK
jgi:hypothetical protein